MPRAAADLEHATLERKRELDHEHRARAATGVTHGWHSALTLRYLRGAVRSWLSAPRPHLAPLSAPRPPAGALAVTFVGHATVMLTSTGGRAITDPLFASCLRGVRRAENAAVNPDDLADVRLVLLSHAHRDHLHVPSLRRLPREATVVVPPRCRGLVSALGFRRVEECAPGEAVREGDMEIVAVAARHGGRRGLFDPTWRGTNGYVLRAPGVSACFAGGTSYFSGFAEIGRWLRPDVALLPIAGYDPPALRAANMSPLDAAAAFEDLGAALFVPIAHGAFPTGYEPLDEPARWLGEIAAARGFGDRLRVLGPGETLLVRGASPPEAGGAPAR